MADEAGPVDIDRAAVRRTGADVSLITYGGTLHKTLQAATSLAAEGVDAEVIDLRTLRPLDMPTILESVKKTHRAVVIDEGWKSGSLSAEIMARIVEQAFYDLDAPLARLHRGGADSLSETSRRRRPPPTGGHRRRRPRSRHPSCLSSEADYGRLSTIDGAVTYLVARLGDKSGTLSSDATRTQ